MSAATTITAPAAPSALLRRPPPTLTPAAPPAPLRVVIAGQLLEHAHAGAEPATGRAAVSVTLAQGSGLPKVLATLWLAGDGRDAMQLAHERARGLLQGDVVEVHGYDLRMRYHHGALAILVGTVTRLQLVEPGPLAGPPADQKHPHHPTQEHPR